MSVAIWLRSGSSGGGVLRPSTPSARAGLGAGDQVPRFPDCPADNDRKRGAPAERGNFGLRSVFELVVVCVEQGTGCDAGVRNRDSAALRQSSKVIFHLGVRCSARHPGARCPLLLRNFLMATTVAFHGIHSS